MKIKHKEYTVKQSEDNNHIAIYKDKRLIFHAQYDEKLSEPELRNYTDDVLSFIDDLRGGEYD